jgi:peptide/nickel transport system permease protein
MLRFVVIRFIWAALTLLVVLTFVFFLARLSGDPVRLMLPFDATAAQVAAMRSTLGLDRPILEQYVAFMGHALTGDLGTSLRMQRSALGIVIERLPATLELAGPSVVIGFLAALAMAVLGEITRSLRLRSILLWAATLRQSIPPYLFGILLVLALSVKLGLLPSMGRTTVGSYVIPIITMSTFEIALYLKLLNSAFDETRQLDWVRTALAKGVSRSRLVLRHILPNALLPLVTMAGINFGILLGGTVVLEMVFNWPGMGRLIIQGVTQRDYPIVQAGVVVTATLFIVINLVVDLLYAVLDPRVRLA